MQTTEISYSLNYQHGVGQNEAGQHEVGQHEIRLDEKPRFINCINTTLLTERDSLLTRNRQLESYFAQLNKKVAKLEYEKSVLNKWVRFLF